MAGLDSLIGGVRAGTEGKFKSDVFISGFLTNTLLAAFLAYLGDLMGQPLGLAAVVALGGRIFVTLSIIRRHWMDRRGGESRNGTVRSSAATPISLEERQQTQP